MSFGRWAPLEGWAPDPAHPGWLAHPRYPAWLRSPDGRWWSAADVLEGRVEMTPRGPRRAPGWFLADAGWVREGAQEASADQQELVAGLRAALRRRGLA